MRDNLEKELAKLEQEVRELKVCQTIAGSMINMYVYTAKIQVEKIQNSTYTASAKFIPKNRGNQNNFAILFLRDCSRWSYYGVTGLFITQAISINTQSYMLDQDGVIEQTTGGGGSGYYDHYIFATVYSNCEGDLTLDGSAEPI